MCSAADRVRTIQCGRQLTAARFRPQLHLKWYVQPQIDVHQRLALQIVVHLGLSAALHATSGASGAETLLLLTAYCTVYSACIVLTLSTLQAGA